MEPPIIAWEPNDMTIFPTIEEAEASVEPWWRDEAISIFDREGRRLVVDGVKGRCKLREVEPVKKDEAGLRQALLLYLIAVGSFDDLHVRSTDELIELATPFSRVPKVRFGFLADFVVDFVRLLMGKKPLHNEVERRREPPTT
jgi:hypothetical protein